MQYNIGCSHREWAQIQLGNHAIWHQDSKEGQPESNGEATNKESCKIVWSRFGSPFCLEPVCKEPKIKAHVALSLTQKDFFVHLPRVSKRLKGRAWGVRPSHPLQKLRFRSKSWKFPWMWCGTKQLNFVDFAVPNRICPNFMLRVVISDWMRWVQWVAGYVLHWWWCGLILISLASCRCKKCNAVN